MLAQASRPRVYHAGPPLSRNRRVARGNRSACGVFFVPLCAIPNGLADGEGRASNAKDTEDSSRLSLRPAASRHPSSDVSACSFSNYHFPLENPGLIENEFCSKIGGEMDFYQVCEVCQERFLSPRKAVRLCPSHSEEVNRRIIELDSLAHLAMESPSQKIREDSNAIFWRDLACPEPAGPLSFSETSEPLPCESYKNDNRTKLGRHDLRLLIPHLRELVIRLLKHQAHHRFPGRFPVSRKFTPPWLLDLNSWEREDSKDPAELVWKAMLRVFAGGTREQPMKAPPQPTIAPDPEADRLVAERKAKRKTGKKTKREPSSEEREAENLAQQEWENFCNAKPRYPDLERLLAEQEARRIIVQAATSLVPGGS